MSRARNPKHELKDLISVDSDQRLIQAILILANEMAEQTKRLEQLLSKRR